MVLEILEPFRHLFNIWKQVLYDTPAQGGRVPAPVWDTGSGVG